TYLSAELMSDQLKPVADAEHRLVVMEDAIVNLRSVGVVDRAGPAAQDHTRGVIALNLGPGGVARQDHGENIELADAARDQLRVLRAEVEDNDGLSGGVTGGGGRLRKGFHVLF